MKLSLQNLLGRAYTEAVCKTRARLTEQSLNSLREKAAEKIAFYPTSFHVRLVKMLAYVGTAYSRPLAQSARGASTKTFISNTQTAHAPIGTAGYYRVGEDGRLYLTSKSEHYHCSLGHGFPGYKLIEHARALGIPNAAHNNTRGHITRLLEEEMVRAANGLDRGDKPASDRVLSSKGRLVLNRVLNLNTGSLAAETAVKLVLSRFYRAQGDSPKPKYEGRTPVLLVIGDTDRALPANYHGTTIITQVMRGMWRDLADALEQSGFLLVRAVRPNNAEDLDEVFEQYEKAPYKIAACFHELVMMNYGAIRLSESFVRRMYALCSKHDVPTVVDEIQTCLWSPELFMFREYGVRPRIVVVGKGFPGGEYAASRILFNAGLDVLPQFGALITNGQEELASLAYLISMRWTERNADVVEAVGSRYEERVRDLAERFPSLIRSVEGKRHMVGLSFRDFGRAKAFVKKLNERGLDISMQTYKLDAPPSALTKLPLTIGYEGVDFIVEAMRESLERL